MPAKPKHKKPAKKAAKKKVPEKKTAPRAKPMGKAIRPSTKTKSPEKNERRLGQFEPGNQFWKLRSKHGRDKLFATPDLLWEAACEYFQWCDENPLIAIEYNGKDAIMCEVPKMRAYTLSGLCLYLNCNSAYFRQFKLGMKKEDPGYDGFSTVIMRIEETIYTQKFEGAAAGFLKENIIVRDLGLRETATLTVNKVGKDLADETYE
jgi:hypothetical protein